MGLEQLAQPGQLAQVGAHIFNSLNNALSGAGQFAGNVNNVSRLTGNIGQQQQSPTQPQPIPRMPNVGSVVPMQIPQPSPPVQLSQRSVPPNVLEIPQANSGDAGNLQDYVRAQMQGPAAGMTPGYLAQRMMDPRLQQVLGLYMNSLNR